MEEKSTQIQVRPVQFYKSLRLRYSAPVSITGIFLLFAAVEIVTAGPAETLEHYRSAISDTLDYVRDQVVGAALVTFFIGLGNYMRDQMKSGNIKIGGLAQHVAALRDALAPAVTLALVVFSLFLFVVTPKNQKEQLRAEKKKAEEIAASAVKQPLSVVVSGVPDTENRQQLGEAKKQIADLQKQLADSRIQNDPLSKPITAARFTIRIIYKDKKESGGTYFFGGTAAIGAGSTALICGQTNMHISDGSVSTYTMDALSGLSSNMGKPIRSLSKGGYFQLILPKASMPIGTEIEESSVEMVINNQIALNFKVPAQRAETENSGGVAIFSRDIQGSLATLATTPPESAPYMGVSPP